MKGLDAMKKLASKGVIIEWNDKTRRPKTSSRQANLIEFYLSSNGLLRRGEAKFI
ncbi:MAG: hypothetical protein KAJ64_03830 [Thermoplasmata archaeon]|nr:hypothetical protein [Thermoplasmata archaeon]